MEDQRSPEEILKAQRMLIMIFGFATLMSTLWMTLMAYNGIVMSEEQGGTTFAQILTYWGMVAPVVWLYCNVMAFVKINRGDAEGAKYYPLIPAFWAIIWFASQVAAS